MSFSGGLLRAGRLAASTQYCARFTRRAFLNAVAQSHSPSPSKSTTTSKSLEAAIADGNILAIHRHYADYVHQIQAGRNQGRNPSLPRGLIQMVSILASSGRPRDLALLEQVLDDSRVIFKVVPTLQMHNKIIKGLLKQGNVQTVYHWLMNLPKKTGQRATIDHWLLFFEHCKEFGEVGMMRQSLKTMGQSGCRPTKDALALLLLAILKTDPRVRSLDQVFIEASREEIPFHESIARLVYDGFAKLGRPDRGAQVEGLYRAKFPEPLSVKDDIQGRQLRRTGMIRKEAEERGLKKAIDMCLHLKRQGCQMNSRLMAAALHSSTKLGDLRYAVRTLCVKANVVHWSLLINNLMVIGDRLGALRLYDIAREEGISPDAAMVGPIINALCFPVLGRPSEAAIDRALQIYRELFLASNNPDPSSLVPKSPASVNSQLYNTLLRALASADNAEKYIPEALSLFKEMALQGIAMEDSSVVTSITIALMRSAQSPEDALEIIKNASSLKYGPGLDAKGYTAVLDAFCRLSFRLKMFLPLDRYFEIVSLMCSAGHTPKADIYTILIRHLIQSPGATRMDVHFAIRKIHDRLLVDTSLTPDLALWNQLMDAYQRAGSVAHAHGIWDMLFVSDQYDNTSVSIIFDACAFAQEWSHASRICCKLLAAGFHFNQRNWNGWVECMCRLGQLDKAVELVCFEMGKKQHCNVEPDEETLRILLKFAKGANRGQEVLNEMKRHFPDLIENFLAISPSEL
ncbi:hypothetical protein HWV62_42572 [Athelia sp. TMB]|nr:hypothetical protein HWV62_42572 [Athelia sp. TMB]